MSTKPLEPEDGLYAASDVPAINESESSISNNPKLREAAVLIPLVLHNNDWHILFIRRANRKGDRHSGQVAFPGGAKEPLDSSLIDTALRETYEEIGIGASDVSVLGTLEPYTTISSFAVTAVVATVNWPIELNLQPDEVARTFLIPMDWLQRRENFTLKPRNELDPQSAKRHPIVVYEKFDGEILWGATARMTLNLFKAVQEGELNLPHV